MKKTKPKAKRTEIHIRIEPELLEAVSKAAILADRPLAAEIRRLLRVTYLKERAA